MQEINWDAMSDHSSDEEIAAGLRKAGLSVSCKRKLSSKKTGKENIRKTRVESSTSENVDFSSQKMDKEDSKRTKDLSTATDDDSIDVNSLPFLENIDGQLYRLEVNEQLSPKRKHVSSANINKKRPRIPVTVPLKVLSSAWSFAASPARTDDREAMIVPKSPARICNDNHNLPITFEEPQSAALNVPVPAAPNDILTNLSAQLTDAHESSFRTASSEPTTPVILDETKPASKTVVPNDLPVTLEEPQSAASNSLVHDFPNDFTSNPPFTDELGSIATTEDNAYELPTHCFAELDNGASISHISTGPEVVIATQVTQRAFDHETDASIVLGPASSGVTVADLETDASIALVSVAQLIPDSVGMFAMPSAAPEAENNNISTSSLSDSSTLLLSSSSANLSSTQNQQNRITILENVPYHGDLTLNKKRNNKATKNSKTWQRNLTKQKRERGENYLGYRRDRKVKNNEKFKVVQDVLKPARHMNLSCNSPFCLKSKLRACHSISEESRSRLFQNFWKQMSWEQRRTFVCAHVLRVEKKIIKSADSNRTESRDYFLTIDGKRLQVCKKMFLATLGVKEWFVRYWLTKTDSSMPPDATTSQKKRKGPEKTEDVNYLRNYLTGLPTMPSHYCRASTSRAYLEPVFENMTDLYKKYKESCEIDSNTPVCRKLFDDTFLKLNLSLFHPKKDQCDLCVGHKIGNITDEVYTQHVQKKNEARTEMKTDKSQADAGKFHVFTQDVESVKLAPFLQASAIYYKTKLCVHNFTLYNVSTKDVMCYWFDESNCTLEASVFATCLVDYLQKTLDRELLPVILYSDGCCAQNRNSTLSNALIRLAIEKQVVIVQKYLEKGHTQMQCDSVHSAIECKVKNKEIYLPEQYVYYTKKAREDPFPYDAKMLEYTFFIDFSKDLVYKTIRPGKKTGDPVVTDIRMLEYRLDGTIWYKLNFKDEIKPLPQRPTPLHRIKPISSLPKLYSGRLPISARKFMDLQDLKRVIPAACHKFYDDLPHL